MFRSACCFSVLVIGLFMGLVNAPSVQAQRHRRQRHEAAATPPPPQDAAAIASARAAYAEGQALFREGRFVESQARFEAAYAAVPNPIVLLSVAETQERQDNLAASVVTLERYLRERTDAPDRDAVQTRIAQLRSRPARVHVMTAPSGAAITVDGQSTGRVTPADIEMTPGDHAVSVSLSHYDTARQSITTTFGARQELHLTLNQTPARQTIAPPVEATPVTEPTQVEPGEPIDVQPTEDTTPLAPVTDETDASANEGSGNTAAWVFAGVGGAALVAGTVLGFMAMSAASDFDATPTTALADRGDRFALLADIAFATAGAAAVTSLILVATHDDEEPAASNTASVRVQVAPQLGRNQGGVMARISF